MASNSPTDSRHSLRVAVLRDLATETDLRFSYIRDRVGPRLGSNRMLAAPLYQMLWELIAERLVYLDCEQNATCNWRWCVTERGRRIGLQTVDFEPDDIARYMTAITARVLNLDEQIRAYASEAVRAFGAECYLASAVMLGVASERAFQLLGEAFLNWLPKEEAAKFAQAFASSRQTYINKFLEFRRRIEPRKDQLPHEFSDNMALTLDSVLDLLRITRNEAGHPTGRIVDRDEAYINLQMFARYLVKLYALRAWFIENARP